MRIGELAKKAGCSTRALRYYEQHGLLRSRRMGDGYRVYDESAATVVGNIRWLLSAGFTLEDISAFAPCLSGDLRISPVCARSLAISQRRLDLLTERIDALTAVRDRLAGLVREAVGRPAA
jgi:DNA-binding transcriptional MerR regulator